MLFKKKQQPLSNTILLKVIEKIVFKGYIKSKLFNPKSEIIG